VNEQKELVYGIAGGALVFIPAGTAADLALLRSTIRSAATFGEARRGLPDHLYDALVEQRGDEYEDPPSEDEPLVADELMGYADGDWPRWPKQEMLEWVPRDVQDEFGHVDASVLNGDFLQLDVARTEELVARLEVEGFSCHRDDALVSRASGYG
jgi:hypothetical protein